MPVWMAWLYRAALIVLIASFPAQGGDAEVERLYAALPAGGCAQMVSPIDHSGTLETVRLSYRWNDLIDRRYRAINENYYPPEQVLAMDDSWTPQIACVSHEFQIPPELLSGIMALEVDLDYHLTDAVIDGLVVSPLGDEFSRIEAGSAFAGVHFEHLRPALASFGPDFSPSSFYRTFYTLSMTRSDGDLTELSTRYRLLDIANAAVMARYYALLRMGSRPLDSMTVTDMAFTWTAYRGGVLKTAADPRADYRWRLDTLQKASDPTILGDSLIAMPYFTYYHALYEPAHVQIVGPERPGKTIEIAQR
ncbi:MAG TPA: hypothetical protein VKQ72_04590 [Aggregatilineales bacterium]|nr:hypothetical protein [Aggregatilineales bacterium]